MKKKLIHPVESGTEVRRFPSFPRTEKGRETKEKGIPSREGMIDGESWSMKILLD